MYAHTQTSLILWKMPSKTKARSMWVTYAAGDNTCSSGDMEIGIKCDRMCHSCDIQTDNSDWVLYVDE